MWQRLDCWTGKGAGADKWRCGIAHAMVSVEVAEGEVGTHVGWKVKCDACDE